MINEVGQQLLKQVLRALLPIDRQSPLWPLACRYGWTILAVAGLGFVASLLEGVGISLLIPLLGTLLSSEQVSLPGPLAVVTTLVDHFEPNTRLAVIGLAMLAFVGLNGIVQALNSTFIAWVDGRASHDVRVDLAHRLLTVGYPFFLREDFARILNVFSTDSWRASDAIRICFYIVANVAACVVFLTLLLLVNWQLTLVVTAGVLAIRLIHNAFMKRAERMSEQVSASNLILGERMLHIVQSMRLIRVFGQEPRELSAFVRASDEVRNIMLRVETLHATAASVIETANAALFMGVLLGAFYAGVPVPNLVAFLVLLYRFQPVLSALNDARLGIAANKASVKEVEWLLDERGKPSCISGTLAITRVRETIAFDGVHFSYAGQGGERPALQDVSFRLVMGRTTALIGPSGAGKSTIISLLYRLIDPTNGRILIDGVPLADLDLAQWRDRIGLAGQDIELIDGSVGSNIRYGAPNASRAEIAEAARLANISDFIAGLPQGFETKVGASGLGLSAGQRQRIGIARALVRRPDFLILDEATNAIDAPSEATILSHIASCPWRPTVLVVSHRPSTLASCQDGIVVEDGRIIEAGPLQTLKTYRGMMHGAARQVA